MSALEAFILIEARYRLHLLHPEGLPSAAEDLLVAGLETPALIELAGLHEPRQLEADLLIDQAMVELDVPKSFERAWRVVAIDYAERALGGDLPLDVATHKLAKLYDQVGSPQESQDSWNRSDWGEPIALSPEVANEIKAEMRKILGRFKPRVWSRPTFGPFR